MNISTLKIGKIYNLISIENSSKTLISYTGQKAENYDIISNSNDHSDKNNSSHDLQSDEENSKNNENDVIKNNNVGKWSKEEVYFFSEILKNIYQLKELYKNRISINSIKIQNFTN